MANDAARSRKALVDHVRACVTQTNACTAGLAQVREAHDALAGQTRTDVVKLGLRADGLNTWCKQNEEALWETLQRLDGRFHAMACAHDVFAAQPWYRRIWALLCGRVPQIVGFHQVPLSFSAAAAASAAAHQANTAAPLTRLPEGMRKVLPV